MFRPFVHLSLIAVLLGCPSSCLWRSALGEECQHGGAVAAEAHPVSGGGCSCCCQQASAARKTDSSLAGDDATKRPGSPTPCDDDRPSGGPCQCICGGALVDDTLAFDAAEAMHAIDNLAVAAQACCLTPVEAEFADGRLLVRQDVLSGRDICRLRALMLC